MNVYIRCNSTYVHFRETRNRLTYGSEQCEGCGIDIAESGWLVGLSPGRD